MGLGIEVVIVDWARVEAVAPGDRDDLLTDAAFDENGDGDRVRHGWSRPTRPGEDWYGRYAFRKSGSYKPHFSAGQCWETMREAVEPSMREVLDQVNDALFRHGSEDTSGAEQVLPERPPRLRRRTGIAERRHLGVGRLRATFNLVEALPCDGSQALRGCRTDSPRVTRGSGA